MIDLTVKIDNEEAKKKLKELQEVAKRTTSSIVADAERMDVAYGKIGKGSETPIKKAAEKSKKATKEVEEAIKKSAKESADATERATQVAVEATKKATEEIIKQSKRRKKANEEAVKPLTTPITAPEAPTNPLNGINETLTKLPEKADKAAGSMGNLNFATQQLVREVPAATMGLHMFFLAISNNLPYFADAIKQVREENNKLAASGKPTTSVFKQIIGSLFSWQTALIAGITALTLYGKEIGNWVKGLFKGKEALDAVAQAEKMLADVRRQGVFEAQEEVTQVKLAVKAMQDSNRSLNERKRVMRTLQDQYPEYFGKLETEQMLYGEVGETVDALIRKMVALAVARKSFDKLVENEQNMSLLKSTAGYEKWEAANDAYNATGRKESKRVESIGLKGGVYTAKTSEYLEFSAAQDKILEKLEEGTKEQQALFKIISEQYDGNIDAYKKAIEESNKKLTEEASALITTPDLEEDREAEKEAKRKAKEAAEEAKRKAEERKRTIQSLNRDLSKEVTRTQREMDDAEIAAIKDGIERKREEIKAGYERRAAEIDKYEADIRAAQGGELTPEQKSHLTYLRQANTDTLLAGKELIKAMRDEAAQEATDAMNEYLISYGTFQEKLLATSTNYNQKIAEAKTEGEKKTLEAERDAILAEFEVQASEWAQELVDKTTKQLNAMLVDLQAQVEAKQAAFDALESSDSKEAEEYRKEINRLKAQIKEVYEQLNEAKKEVGDDKWADATKVFQGISVAANDAAEGIAKFDEQTAAMLKTIAQLAGSAINLIGAIQGTMEAFANGLSTMEKASGILAIIGAAIQAISVITDIFSGGEEATRNATIAILEYGRALEKISNAEFIASYSSIFGNNEYGEYSALLAKTQEQLTELNRLKKEAEKANFVGGTGVSYSYANSYNAQGRLIRRAEQASIPLVADMRSGMQKFFGSGWDNVKITDLEEFYENGKLNIDKLKAYYDTYKEYLSEDQQDLIEELIHEGELYAENVVAMNEYLSSVFGETGATITDALTTAFETGTDAARIMGESIGNIVEQLVSDIAYASIIAPILDDAQKATEALNEKKGELTEEEYTKNLLDIVGDTMDKSLEAQDAWNEILSAAQDWGEEHDMEVFDSSTLESQEATSRGFNAMSQDTGDELNGRFTDIQGKVSGINEAVQYIKSINIEQAQHTQSISQTVAMIHNDTSLIEKHTRVLADIDDKLATMNTTLKNI